MTMKITKMVQKNCFWEVRESYEEARFCWSEIGY